MLRLPRRAFLQSSVAAGASLLAAGTMPHSPLWAAENEADDNREVLPVAAVTTEYRVNSHADVILGKILEGYDQLGGPGPKLKLVSVYTDQVPTNDISREKAKKHGFAIGNTIEEALTLGTGKIAVAGVLSIGEHGKYGVVEKTGQFPYPRRRFFDGIADTFEKYGEVRPVFNDKHLAWNWKDGKHMYDRAKAMKIPFMAGSSVPVAWRVPPLELERGCQIEEAAAIGYGHTEGYGFHALEGLQCMVERRRGGEVGVERVDVFTGDDIAKAEQQGLWSRDLLMAAAETAPANRRPRKDLGPKSVLWVIHYRDGLKATLAMHTLLAYEFTFAARLAGQSKPAATWFQLQEGKPYYHFAYLVRAIDHFIHTGKSPYPVERTLLTTGILDAAMIALAEGKGIDTPYLDVRYEPVDWPFAPGVPPEPRENP